MSGSSAPASSAPVAGLVLAAGGGRRLGGRPKALLSWAGRPLVAHAVSVLRSGGCSSVHVVVGASGDAVRALPALSDVSFVPNPDWETGMGSSLVAGLASLHALPSSVRAVVVLLVDQPTVSPSAVAQLISCSASDVAVSTYAGRRGHPVLLGRPHWDAVASLAVGDVGARAFMAAHPELVSEVSMDPLPFPYDIDTPADFEALQSRVR